MYQIVHYLLSITVVAITLKGDLIKEKSVQKEIVTYIARAMIFLYKHPSWTHHNFALGCNNR